MTTQTKKSPGRPKKAQAATPVAPPPPAAPTKKKRSIKRKEQVLEHKEYEIIKGGGIVYMLPQKA